MITRGRISFNSIDLDFQRITISLLKAEKSILYWWVISKTKSFWNISILHQSKVWPSITNLKRSCQYSLGLIIEDICINCISVRAGLPFWDDSGSVFDSSLNFCMLVWPSNFCLFIVTKIIFISVSKKAKDPKK